MLTLSAVLGISLQNILSRLKSQPLVYPSFDLAYSHLDPLRHPVLVTLPHNGLRLRFDGRDQRLRLIEVMDFTRAPFLSYKSQELTKDVKKTSTSTTTGGGSFGSPWRNPSSNSSASVTPTQGPTFRQIYQQFGPTFPGKYVAPPSDSSETFGTYILSYPGIAFSFPVQHSAYQPMAEVDFTTLLASSATSPATSMAIFNGESWSEASPDLFTRTPPFPRSYSLLGKNRESAPDEIEHVKIYGAGRIGMSRRSTPPFLLTLSETTPQDLVAELGPPDAVYRTKDKRIFIHLRKDRRAQSMHSQGGSDDIAHDPSADVGSASDVSATNDESDDDAFSPSELQSDCFFNYFHHGFDILISHRKPPSPPFPKPSSSTTPTANAEDEQQLPQSTNIPSPSASPNSQLYATKILFHGNIPGSYPFNRHRRCRWSIDIPNTASQPPDTGQHGSDNQQETQNQTPTQTHLPLTSETPYDQIATTLRSCWKSTYQTPEEESLFLRGMLLDRGWGEESLDNSVELLGDWEESVDEETLREESATVGRMSPAGTSSAASSTAAKGLPSGHLSNEDLTRQALSNTQLFGFPGLVFEVMNKNQAVSCLTVY